MAARQGSLLSVVLRIGLTVFVANVFFLVVSIVARPDRELIVQRTQDAFALGDLDGHDYLPYNTARGWHQYNDCNVLQMLVNTNPTRTMGAIAPVIYKADNEFNTACPVLRALVVGGAEPDAMQSFRYARYWHGYNALAGLALRVMPLRELRRALQVAVWVAAGALAVVAWRRGRRTRLTGLSIAFAALAFWAVIFFAPGLTHGPGDAILLLAVGAIVAWPQVTSSIGSIAPFAAAFGSTTVFFSMLTGQLPTAAGWLVAVTLAVARDRNRDGQDDAGRIAITALIAFVTGAAATVIIKQALTLSLAEPGTFSHFLTQLGQYTSRAPAAFGLPAFLVPYAQLGRNVDVLTAGNEALSYALVAIVAGGIGLAAIRAWQLRRSPTGKDMLLLIAAAIIPALWVVLLPLHSYIHAGFMVRMMVVPIAIAPAALFWPMFDRPSAVAH